ncbi:MAG: hypothetical protein IJ007_05630 [Oscillospiraceae bacterium]|nr:hypothetical protein [Oscillospiraceae bacterium]
MKASKGRIVKITLISAVTAAAVCFFATDLIRAKQYKLPPLFCVPVIEYDNGSVDHYGLFYKVWEDYDPFEDTTDYYVGFWLVPKFWSI